MRLFKEEKEFVASEVKRLYEDKLDEIDETSLAKLKEEVRKNKTIESFINDCSKFFAGKKAKTEIHVYDDYVSVELESEDRRIEGRFDVNENFKLNHWGHSTTSSCFEDLFLTVPLQTKAPKEEDERFDVINQIVKTIGEEMVKRESALLEHDLKLLEQI